MRCYSGNQTCRSRKCFLFWGFAHIWNIGNCEHKTHYNEPGELQLDWLGLNSMCLASPQEEGESCQELQTSFISDSLTRLDYYMMHIIYNIIIIIAYVLSLVTRQRLIANVSRRCPYIKCFRLYYVILIIYHFGSALRQINDSNVSLLWAVLWYYETNSI